ncbi:hypothetical protein [Thiohalobacter sp.]|uniref:hypothetical protein n=1 Tax=Thiohalobacter sp. TaxID=2025948 RepID=UPI002628E4DF|nr:hypothetical protein [Thiohalobacter sp.]
MTRTPTPEDRLTPDALAALCGASRLPLAAWYADPLGFDATRELLDRARARLRGGQADFGTRLVEAIAGYWLGADPAMHEASLAASAEDPAAQALSLLVPGQLLAARGDPAALPRLEAGFHRAAPLLAPADYFRVLHRHEQLAILLAVSAPGPARDLPSLLAEASVIARLRGRPRPGGDPGDTLG